MTEFRKVTEADIEALVADMRPADVEEVRLSSGYAPRRAVDVSILLSAWTRVGLTDAGQVLAIFGVGCSGPMSLTGIPWLLGTNALEKNRMAFAGCSRPWVAQMRQGYTRLENWVHADNVVSVRWLRGCGFTVGAPEPHGPEGAMFRHFWMKGDL